MKPKPVLTNRACARLPLMKSTVAIFAAMRDPKKWKLPANASIPLASTAFRNRGCHMAPQCSTLPGRAAAGVIVESRAQPFKFDRWFSTLHARRQTN
jgi:hypothetical protein